MPKAAGQKLRCLKLLEILEKKTNESHPLSAPQLIELLEADGFSLERRSLYDDIKALEESGIDIVYTRQPVQGYFIGQRRFELAELKLLIDAVQASDFITPRKTQLLLQKLSSLASELDAQELNPRIKTTSKAKNEQIFYSIDAVQNAIQNNRVIEFLYFDYDLKKNKQYRRNKVPYELVPYALIWQNQRYYCIGQSLKYHDFVHYRLDKMDEIQVTERTAKKVQFQLDEYQSRIFDMYRGPLENVVLRFDIKLLNAVYDQFGQDVLINETDSDHFTLHLPMNISPVFISWLLRFNNQVRVIRPQSLIDEIISVTKSVSELYEKKTDLA